MRFEKINYFLINSIILLFSVLSFSIEEQKTIFFHVDQNFNLNDNLTKFKCLNNQNNLIFSGIHNKQNNSYLIQDFDGSNSIINEQKEVTTKIGNNLLKYCIDKDGNLQITHLDLADLKLSLFANNRSIYLYEQIFAKLGCTIEANKVLNYSNAQIWKSLYFKLSDNFYNQGQLIIIGDLIDDSVSGIVNHGTIFADNYHSKNYFLNIQNYGGRLEISKIYASKRGKIFSKSGIVKVFGYESIKTIDIILHPTDPLKSEFNEPCLINGKSRKFNGVSYSFENDNSLFEFHNESPIKLNKFINTGVCSYIQCIKKCDLLKNSPKIACGVTLKPNVKAHTGNGIEASEITKNLVNVASRASLNTDHDFEYNAKDSKKSIVNNGIINSKNNLIVTADNQKMVMGTNELITYPHADPYKIYWIKIDTKSKVDEIFMLGKKNSNFFYQHLFENESNNLLRNLLGYLVYDRDKNYIKKNLKQNSQIEVSTEILKEKVKILLHKYTGRLTIAGLNNEDEQINELVLRGFIYSLIHGNPIEIDNQQTIVPDKIKLSQDQRQQLDKALKIFDGKITIQQLCKRFKMALSGKYIFGLTKDQINKAPLSLLIGYLDPTSERIQIGMHIAEKSFDAPTIMAKNIKIFVKSFQAHAPKFVAEDIISISGQEFIRISGLDQKEKEAILPLLDGRKIKLQSNGKIYIQAPQINAQVLELKANKGNNIYPVYFKLTKYLNENIRSLTGLENTKTVIHKVVPQLTNIDVNKIKIECDKKSVNQLEGLIFAKELEILKLKGLATYIKEAREITNIEQRKIAFGLLNSLSILINGEFKNELINLAKKDQVIFRILNMIKAKDAADVLGESIYLTISMINRLAQLSKTNKDLKSLLMNFGIIDQNYIPQISLQINLNFCKTKTIENVAIANPINVKEANYAGKVESTVPINVQNLVTDSKIKYEAPKNKFLKKFLTCALAINLFLNDPYISANANVAKTKINQTTIKSSPVSIQNYKAKKNASLELQGISAKLDKINGTLKEIKISSEKNKTSIQNQSFNLGASLSGISIGYSEQTHNSEKVEQQTTLSINNARGLSIEKIVNKGAILTTNEKQNLNVEAIEHQNIIDKTETEKIGLDIAYIHNSPIPAVVDVDVAFNQQSLINKATISNDFDLKIDSDINRDTYEKLVDQNYHYRFAVPIVDVQKAKDLFDDIVNLSKQNVNAVDLNKQIQKIQDLQKQDLNENNTDEITVSNILSQNEIATKNKEEYLKNEKNNLKAYVSSYELATKSGEKIEINVLKKSTDNNVRQDFDQYFRDSEFNLLANQYDKYTKQTIMLLANQYELILIRGDFTQISNEQYKNILNSNLSMDEILKKIRFNDI